MPLVSIIMPAFNAEKTIAQAIQSVLDQTFGDYEFLIVDDCSGDGTGALCRAFAEKDGRLRLIRNDVNKGVALSRNLGIEAARGQWIAFLDSDDLWHAEKLERQLRFMEETKAVISYTASAFIETTGEAYAYILRAAYRLTYNELLRRNLMSCSSVMVRRDSMLAHKFTDGPIHEDYASWLRIVREEGAAYGLDEPLLTYRLSKTSRSGRRFRSGLMVLRTYLAVGYGFIAAFALTLRYAVHSVTKRRHLRRKGHI